MHTINITTYSEDFAALPAEVRAGYLSRDRFQWGSLRRLTSEHWAFRPELATSPIHIGTLAELLPFMEEMRVPAPYTPPPFDPTWGKSRPANVTDVNDFLSSIGL